MCLVPVGRVLRVGVDWTRSNSSVFREALEMQVGIRVGSWKSPFLCPPSWPAAQSPLLVVMSQGGPNRQTQGRVCPVSPSRTESLGVDSQHSVRIQRTVRRPPCPHGPQLAGTCAAVLSPLSSFEFAPSK